MNKPNREKMIQLREKGYTYQAIGELYGLTRQRIHQIVSPYYKNNKSLKPKRNANNPLKQIKDFIKGLIGQ